MRTLADELRQLQLLFVRVAVGFSVAVIGVSLVIPLYTDNGMTVRILTAAFQDIGGEEAQAPFTIGYLGLLVVLAVLVWTLVAQVGTGLAPGSSWYRSTALVLSILGACIVCLMSLTAAGTDDADSAGGWGGLLLLGGLALATVIVQSARWRPLWVEDV
ncbi:MAG: hypothetical protein ACK5OX_09460 [Desertimonas sp.]